ncbi:MAG TPA: flavodoxin domain-containing protein [Myxococcota bacterium]|jgi:NAD(P)H dehydrogenase (quinone)|nr:flavodoxin domain-containing protein [Myxococcota bacterium]
MTKPSDTDRRRAPRVLVVFASATGRTARLADALAEGAREAGADVTLRSAEEAGGEDLLAADAVVLGSGVHMGGINASMRAFFERCAPLWLEGRLVGRLGAAFATAGLGARGGAELALLSMLANLAEHGMLLVSMPNRLEGFRQGGSHWGPIAWTNPRKGVAGPTPEHVAAARAHGRHVAECAMRWAAGAPA